MTRSCPNVSNIDRTAGATVVSISGDDGAVLWYHAMDNPVPCGDAYNSVSLTNNSDATFQSNGNSEVFAYITNGVPQSYIFLNGADSGTTVFPPPPLHALPLFRSPLAKYLQGYFVPISQVLSLLPSYSCQNPSHDP